jgi:hypothetical protein
MTSPSDAQLGQRCPNPACMGIVEQANAYVLTKLAGRLAADYTPLFSSAAYHALRTQLTAAMLVGDLDATKIHCRAWCKLVIAWTEQQPKRPPQPCAHEWLKDGHPGLYCFRCDSRQGKEVA